MQVNFRVPENISRVRCVVFTNILQGVLIASHDQQRLFYSCYDCRYIVGMCICDSLTGVPEERLGKLTSES